MNIKWLAAFALFKPKRKLMFDGGTYKVYQYKNGMTEIEGYIEINDETFRPITKARKTSDQ